LMVLDPIRSFSMSFTDGRMKRYHGIIVLLMVIIKTYLLWPLLMLKRTKFIVLGEEILKAEKLKKFP
jgi:hypothetical protein